MMCFGDRVLLTLASKLKKILDSSIIIMDQERGYFGWPLVGL